MRSLRRVVVVGAVGLVAATSGVAIVDDAAGVGEAVVTRVSTLTGPGGAASATLDCPAGYQAVAGGLAGPTRKVTWSVPADRTQTGTTTADTLPPGTHPSTQSWAVGAVMDAQDALRIFVQCVNTDVVGTLTIQVAPAAPQASVATCPAGRVAYGGGFAVPADRRSVVQYIDAGPVLDGQDIGTVGVGARGPANGWRANTFADAPTAVAVCGDPAGRKATTVHVVASNTGSGHVPARCPTGSVVVSGGAAGIGFGVFVEHQFPDSGGPSIATGSPGTFSGLDRWLAVGRDSGDSTSMRVAAVCLAGSTPTTTTAPPATTTTTVPAEPKADPVGSGAVTRLFGSDRVDTAIAASKHGFGNDVAKGAVLARADQFADALVGTPLARFEEGPLLLTPRDSLDGRTRAELQRVLPAGATVHLLGGPVALDESIATDLQGAGFTVRRHGGADRFATAVAVADAMGGPSTVLLATGRDFPDALAAGAAAADARGAVLLTDGPNQAPATATYLQARPGATRWALGGPAAAADPGATAIVGTDRFDTAVKAAQAFFDAPTNVGLATGGSFPDALAGGAHIAAKAGPLLLSAPDALPAPVRTYLQANAASLTAGFVYGGPAAVTDAVATEVDTIVRS